jgi:hypothetical protein
MTVLCMYLLGVLLFIAIDELRNGPTDPAGRGEVIFFALIWPSIAFLVLVGYACMAIGQVFRATRFLARQVRRWTS